MYKKHQLGGGWTSIFDRFKDSRKGSQVGSRVGSQDFLNLY